MNIIQKIINFFKGYPTIEISNIHQSDEVFPENPLNNPSVQNGPEDDISAIGPEIKIKF